MKNETSLYNFLSEAAKLSVFAIFILYATGFIIWHSYLASFGISSIDFLQTEYVSAAFCYIFFVMAFAAPQAILCEIWITRSVEKPFNKEVFVAVLCLWPIMIRYAENLYFPVVESGSAGNGFTEFILTILVVHFVTWLVSRKKWNGGKIHKFLAHREYVYVYIVIIFIGSMSMRPNVDKGFLFHTIFLYFLFVLMAGGDYMRDLWAKSSLGTKCLIIVISCLFLISHVRDFGAKQFGSIPRDVGGGMPEWACVKFSPQHAELGDLLNIPALQIPHLSGFSGPVAILLRSQNEVIFYNGNRDEMFGTNFTTTTNMVFVTNVTTNMPVGLNLKPILTTNLTTNVTISLTSHVVTDNKIISARQVRAELIDSIEFSK